MDATHKTNWLGWLLYTIVVCNQYGSWLPVAQFVTSDGDGDIVAAALQTLKRWCKEVNYKWQPRYILTDDSAVEQKAVKLAFRGLIDGEQEVDHLLCQVHSERTLRRRLAGEKYASSRSHLLRALKYCRTRPGCMESIDLAIQMAPDETTKKYISEHWKATAAQWANYAREHSPLLLQVS